MVVSFVSVKGIGVNGGLFDLDVNALGNKELLNVLINLNNYVIKYV